MMESNLIILNVDKNLLMNKILTYQDQCNFHLSAIAPLTIVVAVVANDNWNRNAATNQKKESKR